MPEVDLNKKPILTITSTMTFGKYKGEQVKHVLEVDPSYLIWVHDKIDWLEVDEDLLEQCEDAVEQERERSKRGILY